MVPIGDIYCLSKNVCWTIELFYELLMFVCFFSSFAIPLQILPKLSISKHHVDSPSVSSCHFALHKCIPYVSNNVMKIPTFFID